LTQLSISNTIIQATSFGDSYTFEEFNSKNEPVELLDSKLNRNLIETIELDLGSHCNLNCPLCHRNWVDAQHLIDGNNGRPVEEIIDQLKKFPNARTIAIAGSISEPTLYKDLFKLVEYISSRNVLFYIYTNGDTHRDPEYWKTLGSLCNEKTLVYFTICGTTQELHEKYRVGSNLERILNNHRSFKIGSKYKNDVLQYLKFEYNYKDYEENIENIRKLFSRESSIESMAYRERFPTVNFVPEEIGLRKDLSKKYKIISKVSEQRFKNKSQCKMDCSSFNRKFVSIDNNGKMFPCYLHRIYNKNMNWDFDYTDILDAKFDFCRECEKFTSDMIKAVDGLTRIVEC
jgi:MoaA/NifB/PqqE/SkfB family radical SAM enzyme